jgi:hypothetical protein
VGETCAARPRDERPVETDDDALGSSGHTGAQSLPQHLVASKGSLVRRHLRYSLLEFIGSKAMTQGDRMNAIRGAASSRWTVLATLLFMLGTAQAASGHNVTPQQEEQIRPGMSTSEVQRLLGRPMENIRYRNAPGPIWFYDVIGMIVPVPTIFEVAFDAEGKVISAREYPDLSRNSGP